MAAQWEEHKMYGGEVSLFYLPSKHWYKVTDPSKGWNREFVKSTTSYTKGMPWSLGPLLGWTAKVVTNRYRDLLQPQEIYDEIQLDDFMRQAKRARFDELDKAGGIGTLVHDFCEAFTLWKLGDGPKPVAPANEDARTSLKQFWAWVKEADPQFSWSERKVYSRKYGYVGTSDALRVDDTLGNVICDYKSSSGIRLDYWMQLAAYAKAYEEMTGETVDALEIVWIPKDGEPYQAPIRTDIDHLFEMFLHAKALHDWAKEEGE